MCQRTIRRPCYKYRATPRPLGPAPIAAEVGQSLGVLTGHHLQGFQVSALRKPVAPSACGVGSPCIRGNHQQCGRGLWINTLASCFGRDTWEVRSVSPCKCPRGMEPHLCTAGPSSITAGGVFSCPILLSLLPLENSFQISNLYPTLASGSAFRAPNIGHPRNQGLCNSRAHQAFPTAEVPGTMY